MLQFGIVSKNKIPTAKFDPRRPPPIALTLLDEFPSPLSDEDEQRLSLIYRSLHGVENSRMITFPGRFRAIDDAIESEIGKAFQPGRPIHVHEMAASNAITSLDLFERLRGRFGNAVSVSASDYADSVYVVSVSGWHVVFDVEKRPLQFIGRHFVISTVKERKRHPVNRLIRKWLMTKILPQAVEHRTEARRIALYHPRALAMAARGDGFSLSREDAFSPAKVPCDVLRVMNLSNLIRPESARPSLKAICGQLVDGGLLILGDTPDGRPRGTTTIFQRRGQRLIALRDIEDPYGQKLAVLELDLTLP